MNLPTYIKAIRRKGQISFTLNQAMSDLNISHNAALAAVSRLKAHGDLISPSKGFYVIVPPEHQTRGCIPAEELIPILMNHLKTDYYVSLLSGAQYHGASHQKPGRFQVITNKRIKHPLEFGQIKIELIYKKSLTELPTQDVVVKTGYLKVATPELVTLDLLTYSTRSAGLNHIATVLSELIEAIDADQLIALAKKSGEKAWLQRLGYILEKIETMDDKKSKIVVNQLQLYLGNIMKAYIPLAPELPKHGYPRNKKFGTWQGRLPQELRLAGIDTLAGANAFLREQYIAEFNSRFSVPAEQKGTAFRRTSRSDLNWIFTVQTERVVDKDNTVAIGSQVWQIEKTKFCSTLARSTVTIHEHLDQTVSIRYGPHVVGRYSRTGERLIEAKPKERRGKGGSMEAGENQKQVSPRSHTPLEISPKPRDSHFPTAPTTASVFSKKKAKAKTNTKAAA